MRRMSWVALAFGLTGCVGTRGPVETYRDNRAAPRWDRADARDDKGNPLYSIEEQEKRGRSRFTLFDDDRRILPPTEIDRPGPTGR